MTEAKAMQIEYWPIDKLKPYGRNPRKITQKAIDKVAASLTEYKWRQPIVVDAKGVICAGHTRYAAARKLGMKEVPVHVATDLTPQKIKAYRLADNRTGQESVFDNELLSTEMGELYDEDYDLALIGFDPGEIANLFGIDLEPESEAATTDDAGPYKLTLEFKTQDERQAMLAELQERGVQCKAQGRK